MSEIETAIGELNSRIEAARSRAAEMSDEDRKVMDVGIKQLEKEKSDLEESLEQQRRYDEVDYITENDEWSILIHAVADMFQYDYWYIESKEEFERQVEQVKESLSKKGVSVDFTKE